MRRDWSTGAEVYVDASHACRISFENEIGAAESHARECDQLPLHGGSSEGEGATKRGERWDVRG